MPSTVISRLLLSSLVTRFRCFRYHSAKFSPSERGFEHGFDPAHRQARRERLQAAAVVENAQQRRAQGGLVPQRAEKIQPAEIKLGLVLSAAFEFVEFGAQPRIGQNFVRQIDGVKLGLIAALGVARMILLRQLAISLVNRLQISTWVRYREPCSDPEICRREEQT